MKANPQINRRHFLKAAATVGAAGPLILPGRLVECGDAGELPHRNGLHRHGHPVARFAGRISFPGHPGPGGVRRGKVTRVECSFGDPGLPSDLAEEAAEPGLDWDRWCGPAPLRAYSSVLSPRGIHQGFPAWRNYSDYGSGGVGDWGAHHLDIAQWGLGMDASGPVEVKAAADPKAKRGAKLVYADGVAVTHGDGFGIEFFGESGVVSVNRGRFDVVIGGKTVASYKGKETDTSCTAEVRKAEALFLKEAKVRLYVSSNHIADFLDCVKARRKPITNEQVGARSAICCHLLNQSYYHHASFGWDPARLEFTGGTGDPKWLTREYRGPWSV